MKTSTTQLLACVAALLASPPALASSGVDCSAALSTQYGPLTYCTFDTGPGAMSAAVFLDTSDPNAPAVQALFTSQTNVLGLEEMASPWFLEEMASPWSYTSAPFGVDCFADAVGSPTYTSMALDVGNQSVLIEVTSVGTILVDGQPPGPNPPIPTELVEPLLDLLEGDFGALATWPGLQEAINGQQ